MNSRKVVSYFKKDGKLSTIQLGFLFEAINKDNRDMKEYDSAVGSDKKRALEIFRGKKYISKYDCLEYVKLKKLDIVTRLGFKDVIHEAAWKYMKKNYRQVFRRFLNNKD